MLCTYVDIRNPYRIAATIMLMLKNLTVKKCVQLSIMQNVMYERIYKKEKMILKSTACVEYLTIYFFL